MRKRGQELTKYGHERREYTRHREHRSDITRPAPYTIQRGGGGGRSGGLTGHGDRTGQEASRAAPVLGAMAGQGTREAMAERGAWEAMAERGTREAMADRGAREAMAGQGTREAMAGQGTQEAMAERGAWVSMVDPGTQEGMAGSPPKKISWGDSSSPGGAQEARTLGGTLEALS